MTFYDEMRELAQELTRSDSEGGFGQLGAVRRTVTTGGGPSDPTGGSTTVTDYPARFALLPVEQKDIDGTFIKAGDWKAIVSPDVPEDSADWVQGAGVNAIGALDAISVTTTDKLVTNEGVLTIIDPGRLAPGGALVMYEMLARR